MRVVFICPPNVLENKIEERVGLDTKYMPLDTAFIAAAIESENQVKIVDALALCMTKDDIIKEVEEFNPDIICLIPFDRCRWGLDAAMELSHYLKKLKNVPKVGYVLSYVDDLVIRWMGDNQDTDFAIWGDPELTLKEFCQKDGNPEGVKGIIYRKGSKLIQNQPRDLIQDLDVLPYPARHLIKFHAYARLPHEAVKTPVVDMQISRGCPYRCTFCMLNAYSGKRRRVRSPKKAIEEMKLMKEQYGAKQIHFGDLIFTLDREWMMIFCKLLQKENLGLIWSCQTRVDRVDKELLGEMKKAGCVSILYGLESFNQQCLDLMKKDLTVERTRQGIKETKEAGIEVRCSLMIGTPGETPEIAMKNVDELIALDVDFCQFHTTSAYPGTELHDNPAGFGTIMAERTMKKYDLSGKLFIPNGYKDAEQILDTQTEAYRKFYFRPKYILKRLLNFRQFKRNWEGSRIFWKMVFDDRSKYIRVNKNQLDIAKKAEIVSLKVQ